MKINFILFFLIGILLISSVCAAEYQLKKASDLVPGDVIIDPDGNEIVIEKVEGQGKVKESYTYEDSPSIMNVIWGKIAGRELPEPVVSSGSSDVGLSLGELGVGVRVSGEVVKEVVKPQVEKKSFWQKLMFWRGNE